MQFDDWFNEIEVFSLRSERFFNDLDHHISESKGSNMRMVEWLRAAYNIGREHEALKYMDDGK